MIIERAFGDADFGGDGIDANGAYALEIEQPVGGFENPLFHAGFFGHGEPLHRPVPLHLDSGSALYINYTDRCNQGRYDGRSRLSARPNGRTRTMPLLQILRPTLPILIGASLMLTLSMGLRQSLGIFLQPLTHDIHMIGFGFHSCTCVAEPRLGIPAAHRRGDRGTRRLPAGAGRGGAGYLAGLLLLARRMASGDVMLGAGLLIGTGPACTASGMAMSVASRPVPAALRSTVLGMVSAAGSLGALVVADRPAAVRGVRLARRHAGFLVLGR